MSKKFHGGGWGRGGPHTYNLKKVGRDDCFLLKTSFLSLPSLAHSLRQLPTYSDIPNA